MKIYKISGDDHYTWYHGTDSEPFTEWSPNDASKGDAHYNPLGDAMYVTDKEDFAKQFGQNVYPVKVPKDAKIKKINPRNAESAIRDILNRAMKRVKIDYWGTSFAFKSHYGKILDTAHWSPYDAIIEAVHLVGIEYPDKWDAYGDAVSAIATAKFSKFDAVIFIGTNDPNNIFIGETPTQEILIFNETFKKIFQGDFT